MKVQKIQRYKTTAGEDTLYLPDMDETYHSRDGAIAESMHVFIGEGLQHFQNGEPETLQILEVGFGTGLNALLTARESKKNNRFVIYESLEPFPLTKDLWQILDYGKLTGEVGLYRDIHECEWDTECQLSDLFKLHKIRLKLEDYKPEPAAYHLIYFDAFAPKKQSELWEFPIIEKLANSLKPGGRICTYSAAGQFKRNLKACGLEVLNPSGANGKREMTVGIRPLS